MKQAQKYLWFKYLKSYWKQKSDRNRIVDYAENTHAINILYLEIRTILQKCWPSITHAFRIFLIVRNKILKAVLSIKPRFTHAKRKNERTVEQCEPSITHTFRIFFKFRNQKSIKNRHVDWSEINLS